MKQDAFGTLLRRWRGRRRISQLDLGLAAGVSARHISFLEGGRARPSRSMVVQLCNTLDIPHAERNGMLGAAGFAPVYASRPLDDDDLAHVMAAIEWMLIRHEPFPAFAFDKHWRVVKASAAGRLLLAGVGLKEGGSLLSLICQTHRMEQAIENWAAVAQHFVARLRTESTHLGGDAVLDAAAEELSKALPRERREAEGVLPAVMATRYRAGGSVLSFFRQSRSSARPKTSP